MVELASRTATGGAVGDTFAGYEIVAVQSDGVYLWRQVTGDYLPPDILTGAIPNAASFNVAYAGDPVAKGFQVLAFGTSGAISPQRLNQWNEDWSYMCEWNFSSNLFQFSGVGASLRGRTYKIIVYK